MALQGSLRTRWDAGRWRSCCSRNTAASSLMKEERCWGRLLLLEGCCGRRLCRCLLLPEALRGGSRPVWSGRPSQPTAVPYPGREAGFVCTYSQCAIFCVMGSPRGAPGNALSHLDCGSSVQAPGFGPVYCFRVGGSRCGALGLAMSHPVGGWCYHYGPEALVRYFCLRVGDSRCGASGSPLSHQAGGVATSGLGPWCSVNGSRRGTPGFMTSHSVSGVLAPGQGPEPSARRRG
jgi:hypothetical protein